MTMFLLVQNLSINDLSHMLRVPYEYLRRRGVDFHVHFMHIGHTDGCHLL